MHVVTNLRNYEEREGDFITLGPIGPEGIVIIRAVCLSVCPSVRLSVCLSVCPSVRPEDLSKLLSLVQIVHCSNSFTM